MRRSVTHLMLLLIACPLQADVLVTQGQDFGVDVNVRDGRIAMDLLGAIWVMPPDGGAATKVTDELLPARRPRWSPDGSRILYALSGAAGLRILHVADGSIASASSGHFVDRHASWHPDGERIVFSSRRGDSGFDIWETDLPTGLSWRLTNQDGDETEPAWSANGRHLAYIHQRDGEYALFLRRRGEPDVEIFRSDEPISSLSWRPDGSLLSFIGRDAGDAAIYLSILSEPPITRPMLSGEAFHDAPVSWRGRDRLFFTANGEIRTRGFDAHRSSSVPFRALLEEPEAPPPRVIARRELEILDASPDRLVIRGRRLFDGIWSGYRESMDVLLENGRIAAVDEAREWPDAIVLDLGNVTVLPGLIDIWSAMPETSRGNPGSQILAYGVTTIVTDKLDPEFDPRNWEGDNTPGPRVLPAGDVDAAISADDPLPFFLVVADRNATSDAAQTWRERGVSILANGIDNAGRMEANLVTALQWSPDIEQNLRGMTVISGMAFAGTPGVAALRAARQARAFDQTLVRLRSTPASIDVAASSLAIIAGSQPNGLPPGFGLHAELRALAASGLTGEQLLHTVGSNAARVLGLENQLGRITPGAAADLIIVSGDPLADVEALLNIVAVVRNGRFYSLVSLLERGVGEFDKVSN